MLIPRPQQPLLLPISRHDRRHGRLSLSHTSWQRLDQDILTRAKEIRDTVPLLAGLVHHPMHRTHQLPVRRHFQEVPHVTHQRVRDWRCRDPLAVVVQDLQSRRGRELVHEREPTIVRVGADADVARNLLAGVVQGAQARHGEVGHVVEVRLVEVKRERDQAHELLAEGKHGIVVLVHDLAELWGGGPLIAFLGVA